MPVLRKYQQSLQTLGIQNWSMHRPNVFLGEVSITLESAQEIIIIAEQMLDKSTALINDILTSIRLTHANLEVFQFTKIPHLITPLKKSTTNRLIIFFKESLDEMSTIDSTDSNSLNEIEEHLAKLKKLTHCQVIEINSLSSLYDSIPEKRKLWKQLLEYDNNKKL